jgi:hypothetical protein
MNQKKLPQSYRKCQVNLEAVVNMTEGVCYTEIEDGLCFSRDRNQISIKNHQIEGARANKIYTFF